MRFARIAVRIISAVCETPGYVLATIGSWIDRSAQRQRLTEMTDRELRDIGMSRYDAIKEWDKPFWRE
jgi:uncharacterized protein YjiS (DUF1127 family)